MTAMTLLRAMSDISPQDMEAALRAGSGESAAAPEPEPDSGAERPGIGMVTGGAVRPAEPPRSRLHIGGWAAAAACVLLMAGAILHFQQDDSGFVTAPSVPEQICEITGTEPAKTTARTAETTAAGTTYAPQQNTAPKQPGAVSGDGTAPQPAPEQNTQTEAAPATEPDTTEALPQATTTAVTYAENVPVLVAMADDAGTLTHPDGRDFAHGECTWEIFTDASAIDGYLHGEHPVVTLGSGQKPDEITAQILQNPEMLRIRWQTTDAKWESYGIQYVKLDRDGVLHLHIAMYSDGTPQPQSEWIYETALLCEAGTLPPVTDVALHLIYYMDEPDSDFGVPGIAEWLAYIASLPDDVDIHVDTPRS